MAQVISMDQGREALADRFVSRQAQYQTLDDLKQWEVTHLGKELWQVLVVAEELLCSQMEL